MITLKTVQAGKLRHEIQVKDFAALYSDMPEPQGGEGSAPEPHDYFDLSLGACKALTAILYARHKGMALDGLTVTVHRDDSEERQGLYRLAVTLELQGQLTDAEKERLVTIADRCPIHKLMTSTEVRIETALG
ncbi:OsmC family protein [Gallaecimonas kandeliae]|uniref:OsmC family protein n=1 Tax=Gallaecimonas kandeliae TaxID=3029055 RepID=UPI002648C797|nr:OsmC family protein [Gallaecimonas kandeliae]WKE64656.1 OsmC family protein [Gallaecimonas kandeliae]